MVEGAEEGAEEAALELVPKLHSLHQILEDLRPAAGNRRVALVYNPVGNCTSQCEDFIGHIARLSRRVSPKVPHSRVLRRYMAAVAEKLGLLPSLEYFYRSQFQNLNYKAIIMR